MNKFNPPLFEGQFYHIYNRGNKENIFFNEDNYYYFLKKFDFYFSDYLEMYCYCLLPNHFHLLVRVKEIKQNINSKDLPCFKNLDSQNRNDVKADLPSLPDLVSLNKDGINKFISNKFRLFFMSYSKSVNKQLGRTGSLFQKNFKRKLIDNYLYLKALIYYIHFNPQKYNLTDDFKDYKYSSYNRFLSEKVTKLKKNEVFNWFNGKLSFIEFQNNLNNNYVFNEFEEIEI